MTTIQLNTPLALDYLGSANNAVASARARIASGDIALETAAAADPNNVIVAVDNADLQIDGYPLGAVIVYAAAKGDALNLLIDAKQPAVARLAAVEEQIAALGL
jgi:hypothetical protein